MSIHRVEWFIHFRHVGTIAPWEVGSFRAPSLGHGLVLVEAPVWEDVSRSFRIFRREKPEASRLKAIAPRVEAIASSLEAIAIAIY